MTRTPRYRANAAAANAAVQLRHVAAVLREAQRILYETADDELAEDFGLVAGQVETARERALALTQRLRPPTPGVP